jgi:hypothetical protein
MHLNFISSNIKQPNIIQHDDSFATSKLLLLCPSDSEKLKMGYLKNDNGKLTWYVKDSVKKYYDFDEIEYYTENLLLNEIKKSSWNNGQTSFPERTEFTCNADYKYTRTVFVFCDDRIEASTARHAIAPNGSHEWYLGGIGGNWKVHFWHEIPDNPYYLN